jgi:hypothetical protein
MAMTKALGTTLQTGVTATGISGVHEQSGNSNARGELQVYYDKDGNEISVYVFDNHKEYSWTALLESSADDHDIGDNVTIGGISGVVTQWDVQEQNNDVKRVNIGIRTFPDITGGSSETPAAQTPANGNP